MENDKVGRFFETECICFMLLTKTMGMTGIGVNTKKGNATTNCKC